MLRSYVCLFLIVSSIGSSFLFGQELQRRLDTEKGETRDALSAHPLSWWTKDLLRLDSSGDLMLGFKAPDGRPLTAKDYRTEQTITKVGVIAEHAILQVQTSIHPGPRVIAAGFASDDGSAGEWKDLLVSSESEGSYVEIYALHYDVGGLIHETTAQVFGSGSNAILGSYDPDTGNGGGCRDGYWWIDSKGPHEVNFSPLLEAVKREIPADARFTPNCAALRPETAELKSWVQRTDAKCHTCGGLGEVHAVYRIEQGVAKPVSVSFEASEP